jgi:hypothetical protein
LVWVPKRELRPDYSHYQLTHHRLEETKRGAHEGLEKIKEVVLLLADRIDALEQKQR